MHKTTIALLATLTLAIALPASAAPAGALTRDQVKAELAELHAVGYRMTGEDPTYPVKLQEALAKIAMPMPGAMDMSGRGMSARATSDSGKRTDGVPADPALYRGH